MSQDPLGYDGGDANLYRYVGNSVTDTIDPGGLAAYWSDWFWNVTGPVGIGKYLLDYLAEYDKGKVLSATLDASTPHTLSANNIGRGDNGQIGGIAAAQAQGGINEFSADRAVDAALPRRRRGCGEGGCGIRGRSWTASSHRDRQETGFQRCGAGRGLPGLRRYSKGQG